MANHVHLHIEKNPHIGIFLKIKLLNVEKTLRWETAKIPQRQKQAQSISPLAIFYYSQPKIIVSSNTHELVSSINIDRNNLIAGEKNHRRIIRSILSVNSAILGSISSLNFSPLDREPNCIDAVMLKGKGENTETTRCLAAMFFIVYNQLYLESQNIIQGQVKSENQDLGSITAVFNQSKDYIRQEVRKIKGDSIWLNTWLNQNEDAHIIWKPDLNIVNKGVLAFCLNLSLESFLSRLSLHFIFFGFQIKTSNLFKSKFQEKYPLLPAVSKTDIADGRIQETITRLFPF